MKPDIIKVLFLLFVLTACRKQSNYIEYYNRVNEIDSINRIAKKPELARKEYKRLFRKFEPKNQERIEEFKTYILLSINQNKKFGGIRNLDKLLIFTAPYGDEYKDLYPLYEKFGLDSIQVKSKIIKWKNGLNHVLIDSMSVLSIRDQENRGENENWDLQKIKDKKNANLMRWVLENYGYPSVNRIGIFGNNHTLMSMSSFFSHMAFSDEFPYFERKLREYVKTGDCPPRDYATMVDRNLLQVKQKEILYGVYIGHSIISDTIQTDKNRKKIGLPSLSHNRKISKDFQKKMREKN